jgi:hypothetical protein
MLLGIGENLSQVSERAMEIEIKVHDGSLLVKPSVGERREDERGQRSNHQRDDGARREEAERTPGGVAQADDKPPCERRMTAVFAPGL